MKVEIQDVFRFHYFLFVHLFEKSQKPPALGIPPHVKSHADPSDVCNKRGWVIGSHARALCIPTRLPPRQLQVHKRTQGTVRAVETRRHADNYK